MNDVIGTLILVDAMKIINDFDIISSEGIKDKIPVIDLKTPNSGKKNVLMITQKKFIESGLGSPHLSILANPGDEIRWWVENTSPHSNLDVIIKSITPDDEYAYNWNNFFENFPEEYPEKQEHNLMVPPYLSNKDQFWNAQYIISKYRVKTKKAVLSNKETMRIPYKIELQIIINQNHWYKKASLCKLVLHPSIVLKSPPSEFSNYSETAENHVTARLIDGNFFVSN